MALRGGDTLLTPLVLLVACLPCLCNKKITKNGQKVTYMADIDEIREHLQDRVSSVVAKGSGVNRRTVADIKSGENTNARKSTLIALAKYLGVDDDGSN